MNKFCVFTLAAALTAAVFSCKKAENEVPLVPEIKVSGLTDEAQKAITVNAVGEECYFSYEIVNQKDGISMKAEADKDWISGLEAKDGKVTFTVAANGDESDRTATISLSYEGAADVKVNVIQKGYIAPSITVSQQETVAAGSDGGDFSFTYEVSNPIDGVQLSATANADWISVNSTADGTVSFAVSANTTFEKRSAVITLSYTGAEDVTVNVEQAALLKPVITVSQQEPFSVEADGGEFSFTYEISNPIDGAQLNVTANADWISILSSADGEVRFSVAANQTETVRSASITLSYSGADNVSVAVSQDVSADIPVADVEVTDFRVADGKVYYTVTPNDLTYKWTAVIVLNNDKSMNSKTDQELLDGWIQEGVTGPNARARKETRMGVVGKISMSMTITGMNITGDYFFAIAAFHSNGTMGKLHRIEFSVE